MLKNNLLWLILAGVVLAGAGCRYDMQDQPRYKSYKSSTFFKNGMGSRPPVEGTVARGNLREDAALYTGKKDTVSTEQVQSTIGPGGNTLVTSFPNAIDTFPIAVTKETLDRGEQRYQIFCGVCHGPVGNGDGMIVRRGFPKPPTYHDDRLRNAPVGHFFDVATNGWGRMNGYASQISVQDRWAIVAYIRALQISQNPNGGQMMPGSSPAAEKPAAETPAKPAGETTANTSAKPANASASPANASGNTAKPAEKGGNH